LGLGKDEFTIDMEVEALEKIEQGLRDISLAAADLRPLIETHYLQFTFDSRSSRRWIRALEQTEENLSDLATDARERIEEVRSKCEHEWGVVDDSFDHEYGTEKIVFERCQKCDAEQKHEPPTFDDDVL